MAGIYNLLDYLVPGSYNIVNAVNASPLSTWEVDGVLLKTNTPTSATRPNSVSSWRPYPWLKGAVYDFSSIAEPGSLMRFRITGTATKAVAFTSASGMSVFAATVDEGDHYSFVSGWGTATEIYDPSATSVVTSFYMYGPGSGSNSLSGLEAEVLIEVEILDPPPMTVYTQWSTYVLETGDACNYDLPLPENVTATSATLRIYSGSASYSSVYSSCSMHAVTWDESPTDEYDIDLEDVNLYTTDNYIYLDAFSNPNLFDNSNAELLITVEVDLGATRYTTTLTTINYGGG